MQTKWTDERIEEELGKHKCNPFLLALMKELRNDMQAELDALVQVANARGLELVQQRDAARADYEVLLAWAKWAHRVFRIWWEDGDLLSDNILRDAPDEVRSAKAGGG